MISLLVALVVFCLVGYLLFWLLNRIPLPEPVKLVATILFVLIVIVCLLNWFLPALPPGRFLR